MFGVSQTADNPRKHKNSFRQKKSGRNFCLQRQLHLQPKVTYVYVSSLGCKFASLPCRIFQRLAKRRLCQRFERRRMFGVSFIYGDRNVLQDDRYSQ